MPCTVYGARTVPCTGLDARDSRYTNVRALHRTLSALPSPHSATPCMTFRPPVRDDGPERKEEKRRHLSLGDRPTSARQPLRNLCFISFSTSFACRLGRLSPERDSAPRSKKGHRGMGACAPPATQDTPSAAANLHSFAGDLPSCRGVFAGHEGGVSHPEPASPLRL